MKDIKLKSFEFASDLTKQLITLSTILIGLSITFFESFSGSSHKWLLIVSWVLLFLTIPLGIMSLMALTGNMASITNDEDLKSNTIYKKNIRFLSGSQIVVFAFGVIFLIIYSATSNLNKSDNLETTDEIRILQETTYKLIDETQTDTIIGINK